MDSPDGPAAAAWRAAAVQCRGCAAKVDPATLQSVLDSLPQQPQAVALDSTNGKASSAHQTGNDAQRGGTEKAAVGGDDAAILPAVPSGHVAVQTVDFLSACVPDSHLFGRIAAVHAMSDCFAMGADPSTALAIAQVCELPLSAALQIGIPDTADGSTSAAERSHSG